MSRSHARLVVLDDSEAIAYRAAEYVVTLARDAIQARGRFVIALSGGSTPRRLHEMLASTQFRTHLDWSRVIVFWGDERFVPPDSPDSNQRMAHESLLSQVPIDHANVFPVETIGSPQNAATKYEQLLVDVLGPDVRFDLILLGLGEDGHTASLFPGVHAVESEDRFVRSVSDSPKPPADRITITFKTINRARCVLFLVSGPGKRRALGGVLDSATSPVTFPAKHVGLPRGSTIWLVDRAAYSPAG